MNGLLDPEYWRAVNERLVGILGPQMERLNEVGGLLSGTITPQDFMGMRAQQVKQSMTPDEMMNNFAGTGLLGKIVYHGSPHMFGKFDASKIGTGQGAQAYGRGIYLADEKTIGQSYLDAMSDWYPNGMRPPSGSPADRAAAWVADEISSGAENPTWTALKKAERFLDESEPQRRELLATLRQWNLDRVPFKRNGGLYVADLPDEWIPKMLDWDRPLREQPHILSLLEKDRQLGRDSVWWRGAPEGMWRKAMDSDSRTGEWLYRNLRDNDAAATSDAMRMMGIPGIRYLDGASRRAGKGTYNYVVFPGLEDRIKILERNGIPLTE